MNNTKTRADYMAHRVSHEEYYGQFAIDPVCRLVKERIGIDAILASEDPHFNDIPLARWDAMFESLGRMQKVRDRMPSDESMTMAVSVCILKAAARKIKLERTVAL